MGQLYTVGHSILPKNQFINLLKAFDINYLLDVRSIPFSRYAPQYNYDVLNKMLLVEGIKYSPMGKYFGARQDDDEFYPEGYLDFELYRKSSRFVKGSENVLKGLEKYNIALMCTEKDPIDCHRAIMVARGFELMGVDVKHILHDSTLINQESLNHKLLDRYFPDRKQLSLFQEDNKTEGEYLTEAYRARNREIGYRKVGVKVGAAN